MKNSSSLRQSALRLLLCALVLSFALHARAELPRILVPKPNSADSTREAEDLQKYPQLMTYLNSLNLASQVVPSDPRNAKWVKTSHVYVPTMDDWKGFWLASAEDHVTCLRAFGLLSRKIRKEGVVVFGPGSTFEKSVADNHID